MATYKDLEKKRAERAVKDAKEAEKKAKAKKVGMWHGPGLVGKMLGQSSKPLESPREYKTRMAKDEGSASPQKAKS